jgi:hypothetical protein
MAMHPMLPIEHAIANVTDGAMVIADGEYHWSPLAPLNGYSYTYMVVKIANKSN